MALREKLGVPVIPMVATKGVGFIELRQAVSRSPLPPPPICAQMPIVLEREVDGAGRSAARRPRSRPRRSAPPAHAPRRGARRSRASRPRRSSTPRRSRPAAPAHRRHRSALRARRCPLRLDRHRSAPPRIHTGDRHHALSISDRLDGWLTHRVWGWVAFLGDDDADVFLHLHRRAVSDGLDRRRRRARSRIG